jgi:adenylate cyclase
MAINPEGRKTLLLVDDTPDNLHVLNGILRDDYQLRIATSGEKALEAAAKDPVPDLVLLDVTMPGMDGYEVCHRLKADPRTRDVPVIFLTALTQAEDEAKGFEVGGVDYVHKPITPATVLARVRTHLEVRESRRVLEAQNRRLHNLSGQLSKYLSPQVYESIFSGATDASLKAQRKKLTIFFSDIKDFTATSESLSPEDLTYLLNKYFTEMSTIALAHGATIDKFVGDAMLMFFGDPQTRGVKEDALACVRMAIAMQRRMRELQGMWRDKGYENPFEMRIGINTGFCNVGNFGAEARMDYTIIGAEVNLAARLEQNAEPGSILLSYETYALARDQHEADPRPPVKAKGISKEIQTFALRGIYDDVAKDERYVRREREGLRVVADLDRLTGDHRTLAVADLEHLLARLRSQP